MTYEQYISSDDWKQKRQQRIDFDGGRCAICHDTDRLSVHHLHYETLGNEDIAHDLITACQRCHHRLDTIERYNRYERRVYVPNTIEQDIPERLSVTHGMAKSTVSIDISLPDDYALRADRRPIEQIRKSLEANIIEAHQDRCRL